MRHPLNLDWKTETDNNGDVWFVLDGAHKWYMGDMETTDKYCFDFARILINLGKSFELLLDNPYVTVINDLEELEF